MKLYWLFALVFHGALCGMNVAFLVEDFDPGASLDNTLSISCALVMLLMACGDTYRLFQEDR